MVWPDTTAHRSHAHIVLDSCAWSHSPHSGVLDSGARLLPNVGMCFLLMAVYVKQKQTENAYNICIYIYFFPNKGGTIEGGSYLVCREPPLELWISRR